MQSSRTTPQPDAVLTAFRDAMRKHGLDLNGAGITADGNIHQLKSDQSKAW